MKIHEIDDAKLGAMVKDRHRRLSAAHAAGLHHTNPVSQWNADSKTLRNLPNLPANSGVAKEIELSDHGSGATDDPSPHTPGTPAAPERNGASLSAADAALEDLAIRRNPGHDLEGKLHLARLNRSGTTSESVRGMAAAVPGYDRLK